MSGISHDSETPAQGQQVITATAFIHHKINGVEKVFLPKRSSTKKFLPNVFELPGGHIDFGENITKGLMREIHEEFGMKVKIGSPFAVFTYMNKVKGSHSIEVIYFARFTDPIDDIAIDPEDHSEFGWYAEDELSVIIDNNKNEDDDEIIAIRQGFALLRGDSLNFQ